MMRGFGRIGEHGGTDSRGLVCYRLMASFLARSYTRPVDEDATVGDGYRGRESLQVILNAPNATSHDCMIL